MKVSLYYLLTRLPALPNLGEVPPISWGEIIPLVESTDDPGLRSLIEILRCESDVEAIVRARFEKRNDEAIPVQGLPGKLAEAVSADCPEQNMADWHERVWNAWFDAVEEIGKVRRCRLLTNWAQWERSLREELVIVRQNQSPNSAPASSFVHQAAIDAWRGAANPLDAERALDGARMAFLEEHGDRYGFSTEELIAYLLKLRLLQRYHRLDQTRARQLLREVAGL
ncbi:MAG: DUF2764 family protein [Candidatus Ozemobacteraceae bacterium]